MLITFSPCASMVLQFLFYVFVYRSQTNFIKCTHFTNSVPSMCSFNEGKCLNIVGLLLSFDNQFSEVKFLSSQTSDTVKCILHP